MPSSLCIMLGPSLMCLSTFHLLYNSTHTNKTHHAGSHFPPFSPAVCLSINGCLPCTSHIIDEDPVETFGRLTLNWQLYGSASVRSSQINSLTHFGPLTRGTTGTHTLADGTYTVNALVIHHTHTCTSTHAHTYLHTTRTHIASLTTSQ